MNADTGHIVADLEDIATDERNSYQKLRGHNAKSAVKVLGGRKECYIDLSEKSRLANKARNIRKKKKKMSQKSKTKNRSK